MQKNIIGKKYEAMAGNYLKRNGYKILQFNYKNVLGEIDLICKEKNYIVFVEVKYRSNLKFGRPLEAINLQKQNKIRAVATLYLETNGLLEKNVRFDAVEILDEEIRLIKNAF